MKQIKFQYDSDGLRCTTLCPFKEIPNDSKDKEIMKVGSITCCNLCNYFKKVDNKKDIVYCNHE